jgi:hypothetical protein
MVGYDHEQGAYDEARQVGLMLVVLLVAVGSRAMVQSQPAPTSMLDKLTATRSIALGYRESSVPFFYVGSLRWPIATSPVSRMP